MDLHVKSTNIEYNQIFKHAQRKKMTDRQAESLKMKKKTFEFYGKIQQNPSPCLIDSIFFSLSVPISMEQFTFRLNIYQYMSMSNIV